MFFIIKITDFFFWQTNLSINIKKQLSFKPISTGEIQHPTCVCMIFKDAMYFWFSCLMPGKYIQLLLERTGCTYSIWEPPCIDLHNGITHDTNIYATIPLSIHCILHHHIKVVLPRVIWIDIYKSDVENCSLPRSWVFKPSLMGFGIHLHKWN